MRYLILNNCNLYLRDHRNCAPQEFISRYLQDPKMYEVFLRNKYRQFIKYAINCGEIKKGFVFDFFFMGELLSIYYQKYSYILPTLLYAMLVFFTVATNLYFQFYVDDSSGSIVLFFRALFYASVICSIASYFVMMRAEVIIIQKRDVYDDNSIIQQLLTNIEEGNFSKMVPLQEICFNTNIRKIKHAEYCEKCDQYVIEYQKYCNFLDRPIGAGNANLYFLWLITGLIMIGLFNISMLGCFWGKSEVIFYYRYWD